MSQGNTGQDEKIVLVCDFCRKYNVSKERAMSLGIDNSNMERLTKNEFEMILKISQEEEEVTFKEGAGLVIPFEGEHMEVGTNISLSQIYEGDTCTTTSQVVINPPTKRDNIPRRYVKDRNIALLYSEVTTVSETKYDLLESSLPPPEPQRQYDLLASEQDNEFEQEYTQTLLFTSES